MRIHNVAVSEKVGDSCWPLNLARPQIAKAVGRVRKVWFTRNAIVPQHSVLQMANSFNDVAKYTGSHSPWYIWIRVRTIITERSRDATTNIESLHRPLARVHSSNFRHLNKNNADLPWTGRSSDRFICILGCNEKLVGGGRIICCMIFRCSEKLCLVAARCCFCTGNALLCTRDQFFLRRVGSCEISKTNIVLIY